MENGSDSRRGGYSRCLEGLQRQQVSEDRKLGFRIYPAELPEPNPSVVQPSGVDLLVRRTTIRIRSTGRAVVRIQEGNDGRSSGEGRAWNFHSGVRPAIRVLYENAVRQDSAESRRVAKKLRCGVES